MAPTPPFVGAIPIKPLDHGDRVKQLQQMLIELGFDVGPDGVDGEYGPDSQQAFQNYQFQAGQELTGIVCMEDWYALVEATSEAAGG